MIKALPIVFCQALLPFPRLIEIDVFNSALAEQSGK